MFAVSVVSVSGAAGCNCTRRLEKEDVNAKGVLVTSTSHITKESRRVKLSDRSYPPHLLYGLPCFFSRSELKVFLGYKPPNQNTRLSWHRAVSWENLAVTSLTANQTSIITGPIDIYHPQLASAHKTDTEQ
jgi:hypothetical protein